MSDKDAKDLTMMAAAPRAPLLINRAHRLAAGEWHDERYPKDLLVLHHTVGGSALSSLKHWQDTKGAVGTMDLVERNGEVLEVFPPEAWAVHLFRMDALPAGLTSAQARAAERRSAGIELASEGALTFKNDGGADSAVWAFGIGAGKYLGRSNELAAAGRIVRMPTPWRGFQYFDAYDAAQVTATIRLVQLRCQQLGIPPVLHSMWADPDAIAPADWLNFRGVVTHAMLRPDKTDLHLLFPYERLAAALAGKPYFPGDAP